MTRISKTLNSANCRNAAALNAWNSASATMPAVRCSRHWYESKTACHPTLNRLIRAAPACVFACSVCRVTREICAAVAAITIAAYHVALP